MKQLHTPNRVSQLFLLSNPAVASVFDIELMIQGSVLVNLKTTFPPPQLVQIQI